MHFHLLHVEQPRDHIEHQPGQEQCAENAGDDTDAQCYGESLHRAGAHRVQNDAGEQRCNVGVQNRARRLRVADPDCLAQLLANRQFLADTFKNQHIGVHRHTDGQNNTGDTRQRQRGVERRQRAENQHHVDRQREHRHQTGPDVVPADEHRHQQQRDAAGDNAVADVFPTERRVHIEHCLAFDHERNTAGGKRVGDLLGLLLGKVAADLGVAVFDRVIDGGRAVKFVVQHNCQSSLDVVAGDLGETPGSGGVERQPDGTLVILRILLNSGVGNPLAVHLPAFLDEDVVANRLPAGLVAAGKFD